MYASDQSKRSLAGLWARPPGPRCPECHSVLAWTVCQHQLVHALLLVELLGLLRAFCALYTLYTIVGPRLWGLTAAW